LVVRRAHDKLFGCQRVIPLIDSRLPTRVLVSDRLGSEPKWFCFGQPVGGFEQVGQVIERIGDIGMVRAEALFRDGQKSQ
jgi:hypothetical protein